MKETERLLKQLGLSNHQSTASNIRENGRTKQRIISNFTTIVSKPNNAGLEIHVADNARFEIIDIPALITQSGFEEAVQNDIYIGSGANVIILAGCGICNDGCDDSMHRGVHNFWVGEGAQLKYIERHYATGDKAQKIINPSSVIKLEPGAEMIVKTSQLGGVDKSERKTKINLKKQSKIVVTERIFTSDKQFASSLFEADITQSKVSLKISSRSVATDDSAQKFVSKIVGQTACFAHVECDAIIKDRAKVNAIPQIYAQHHEAQLIHEASIGKIANEQLNKLMTLGMTRAASERAIIDGFLK